MCLRKHILKTVAGIQLFMHLRDTQVTPPWWRRGHVKSGMQWHRASPKGWLLEAWDECEWKARHWSIRWLWQLRCYGSHDPGIVTTLEQHLSRCGPDLGPVPSPDCLLLLREEISSDIEGVWKPLQHFGWAWPMSLLLRTQVALSKSHRESPVVWACPWHVQ